MASISRWCDSLIALPEGIKGDITITSMDCSPGWAVWYGSALEALEARLTAEEIKDARLPEVSKTHLIKHETESAQKLTEVINIFGI